MKKILLITILSLAFFTGCETKEKDKFSKYEESNNKIVNDVKDITTEEGNKEFLNMMVLDNNTLETQFGLTVNDVDNYVAQVSYELDARMYLAFKPANGKEERVKKLVGLYIDSVKTRLEMEKNNMVPTTNELGETIEPDTSYIDKQINMIDNMLKEEYNGYLIYISSSSNDLILSKLKDVSLYALTKPGKEC